MELSKKDKLNIGFGLLALVAVFLPIFTFNDLPVKVKDMDNDLIKAGFYLSGLGMLPVVFASLKAREYGRQLRVVLIILAITGLLTTVSTNIVVAKDIADSNKQIAEFQRQFEAFGKQFDGFEKQKWFNIFEEQTGVSKELLTKNKLGLGVGSIMLSLSCLGLIVANRKTD